MSLYFKLVVTIQLILYIRSCGSSSHSCTSTNPCTIVDCTLDQNCEIICNGWEACKDVIVNCYNAEYACDISCNQGYSCFNMKINGKDASSLTVTTPIGGIHIMENAKVICPNNGKCSIDCRQDYKVCENMTINAESSTSVNLRCRGEATTCHNIKIYCPVDADTTACIIEGIANTNSLNIANMDIYSRNGFASVDIIGPKTKFPASSIGKIHCAHGYTSTCIIDEMNNQICESSEPDKTCENVNVTPAPTTNDPTRRPTKYPTNFSTKYSRNSTQHDKKWDAITLTLKRPILLYSLISVVCLCCCIVPIALIYKCKTRKLRKMATLEMELSPKKQNTATVNKMDHVSNFDVMNEGNKKRNITDIVTDNGDNTCQANRQNNIISVSDELPETIPDINPIFSSSTNTSLYENYHSEGEIITVATEGGIGNEKDYHSPTLERTQSNSTKL